MPHYAQLTQYEREQIASMRASGSNYSEIGRCLSRPACTIWRECRRNSQAGKYLALQAHQSALKRRSKARRPRKVTGQTAREIKKQLRKYWSPEQIMGRGAKAGRLRLSAMTIYRALDCPEYEDYRKYLRGPTRKRKRNKRLRSRIHDRIMIDQRPTGEGPGDWEGDTIRSPMHSWWQVLTVVERSTQYLVARLLCNRNAATLNRAVARALKEMPVRSLTVDNGMEFASHKELTRQTGIPVYFAHAGCPWERGLNEQVNGLIRQFLPKGTDFSEVTAARLREVVALINNRPRKTLGYRTPLEAAREAGFALAK